MNINITNGFFDPKLVLEVINTLAFLDWREGGSLCQSLYSNGDTVVIGQGGDHLRGKVVQLMSKNIHALSPYYLRVLKGVNDSLFQVLLYKRVGHAFRLSGELTLTGLKDPSDEYKVNLEAFHETFTLPMVASSFLRFLSSTTAQEVGLSEEELGALLVDMNKLFQEALWHDNLTDAKLQETHAQIHNKNYLKPILLGSGWDWHSTQVIFFKNSFGEDFFIYCNCGNDSGQQSGWVLFKIRDKSNLDTEWLKWLTARLNYNQTTYCSLKNIVSSLNATQHYYGKMKRQGCGNCTVRSYEAAISAFLNIWIASKRFSHYLGDDFIVSIEVARHKAKEISKLFKRFDQKECLENFLEWNEEICCRPPVPTVLKNANIVLTALANKIIDKAPKNKGSFCARVGWGSYQKLIRQVNEYTVADSNYSMRQSELIMFDRLSKVVSDEYLVTLISHLSPNPYEVELLLQIAISWKKYDIAGVMIENFSCEATIATTYSSFVKMLPEKCSFEALVQIANSPRLSKKNKQIFLVHLFHRIEVPFSVRFDQLIQLLYKVADPEDRKTIRYAFKLVVPVNNDDCRVYDKLLQVALGNDTISIDDLKEWLPTRDALILWSRLSKLIHEPGPSIDQNNYPQFLQQKEKFAQWSDSYQQELAALKTLWITAKQPLLSLPKEISKLTNLTHLEIQEISLTTVPKEIYQLKSLRHLTCKELSARTFSFPKGFDALQQLVELCLYDLPIQSLPLEIAKLTKLERLSIQHCQNLTFIPKEIEELSLKNPEFKLT